MKHVYQDAFNMLAGSLIGEGIHRKVFECKIRSDLVVKVEKDYYREFANVREMKFWCDNQFAPAIAKWLAPCEFLSPDGRVLLQKRCDPVRSKELPDKLPAFLTDTKPSNFGWLAGKIVCVDYGFVIQQASTRMVKATWL